MSSRPAVSVIVPAYAAEATLGRCLDSLVAQTLENIEIIVVNDASPDATQVILDTYAARDKRIRAVANEKNRNLYDTRRRGFALAEGEYLAACDADDAMPPNALAILHERAQATGADLVHGRAREMRGGGSGGRMHICDPFRVESGAAFVSAFLRHARGWNVWGKLFRKEAVAPALAAMPKDRGWFLAEDLLFCYFFGLAAKRYAGVDGDVYLYNVPEGNYFGDAAHLSKRLRDQFGILDTVWQDSRTRGEDNLRADVEALIRRMRASVMRNAPLELRREALTALSDSLGAECWMGAFGAESRAGGGDGENDQTSDRPPSFPIGSCRALGRVVREMVGRMRGCDFYECSVFLKHAAAVFRRNGMGKTLKKIIEHYSR